MLHPISLQSDASLYEYREEQESLKVLLFSSPETRAICNDPFVMGPRYTGTLTKAMGKLFRQMEESEISVGEENSVLVLNILRGGLNFGLREALHEARGWEHHRSAFISSQRAYDEKDGWYITENRYEKIPAMRKVDLVFADVVATGVSLEHAVYKIMNTLHEQGTSLGRMTFITIGGPKTIDIFESVQAFAQEKFPGFQGCQVVFLEGIFGVAESHSPLSIALQGTDLLRDPAILTPEFEASQAESLAYPLERCTIYDAGSRAYDTHEYLEDVHDYWSQVLALAERGMTLTAYLRERYPQASHLEDASWCQAHDTSEALAEIAQKQLEKCK